MSDAETLRSIAAFAASRWGPRPIDRAALLRRQQRRLSRFLARVLPDAPFYREWADRPLSELPIVDKATVLADFAAFNTRGVTLEQARTVALAAERSRDFAPTLGDLTVGLSSGTSGRPGVFLVSPRERAIWAGALLARVLSTGSLLHLLDPRRRPLRVAFFLRANSNLYRTVANRRIAFSFHDLLMPLEHHLERLNQSPPDILIGPPTVLRRLASHSTARPRQVISVAEVLEADDQEAISSAFGVPVQQIYQATEGWLGTSCGAGRIHLEEDRVHIEPEWLDSTQRRFVPIVTDFSRTTQLVVRYRLDDVLRTAEGPCSCGRPTLSLDAIEGRADDVLWAIAERGEAPTPIFPDTLRRAFALAGAAEELRDYRVEQRQHVWEIQLDPNVEASVRRELDTLLRGLGLRAPRLSFRPWSEAPLDKKRRRLRCIERPTP